MKRLFAFAPGLFLAAMTAIPVAADEPLSYNISDDVYVDPFSVLGDAPTPDQKDDSCVCDTKDDKGGKGGKGGCSCYLWGPDEPFSLYSGDNGHGITAGGWTQFGYHNQQTPLSTAINDGLSFNDHKDRLNLHQQWLWVEKALSGDECSWDWGFRMDFMYGFDASKTQAFGGLGWDNDPTWDRGGGYGYAIPQLYGEIGKGPLSVKFGHFYTLVGYEVVTAPGNFFYSHALTMFNTEPFTHSGVVGTYGMSDDLEVYGGWTLGWDTGFEGFNDGNSWLGGFSYNVTDDVTFTYISTAGNFGARGKDAYSHSVVLDVTLTEKLNYVFQSDLLSIGDLSVDPTQPREAHDDDVGINQYLFYSYNDCLGFGGRMEWWKDDGHSHYAVTGGINYRPHANFILRPEIRHDWQPFANFDVTTFGMDAILTY